jgi:hypothetical protein
MSEHQPPPGAPGRATTDTGGSHAGAAAEEADEAELIKKVMRTQERHREGGVDADLEEDAPGQARDTAAGDTAAGSPASGGGHSGG